MAEAITIVILGSISGLKNTSQIQQWASDERVSAQVSEYEMTFAQRSVEEKQ